MKQSTIKKEKLTKNEKEEIRFWKKAKKLIQDGYGKDPCKEMHLDCAACRAHIAIGWINSQIGLLEWKPTFRKNKK